MDLNFPEFLLNETVRNDNLNPADLTQNYLLLKKKICETHEVIKQYNDKLKECERMKSDLDSMTKQAKKVTCSYNTTLAKIIKLKIQNKTYEDNITTLTTQVNDHKIKAAADQQYIQQLVCKIKDVENQSNDKVMQYDLKYSSSEMKIKELETELKTIKKTYETKIKKLEKKSVEKSNCHSNSDNIITKNVATNTSGNSNNTITKDVATNTCGNSDNTITKDVATNTCGNSDNTITKDVATNTCGNSDNVITKNVASNTTSNETIDVGTMTILTKKDIMIKSEVTDKCVLTDEFYSANDMYPIFCAKCEVHLDPPPIDKICKIMMESCPKLLENISSPPKTPALVRPAMTNRYRNTENIIALPETNPPYFHAEGEITRSASTSPNLSAPLPLNHIDYCHNFSQPPNSLNQNASSMESTPIRSSLANTTTASQTDRCEDKRIDECSQSQVSSLVDKLEKKQRKKIKRLKKKMKELESQKSSTCCQQSHPTSSYMSDMNNTAVQLNLLELLKSLTGKHQVQEKEPVVVYKPRDKTRKKSRLSRPETTKRLQSVYRGNSWKVESVSKKAEKSSARKRPKKRKHKHSMLLKKSDVSVNNSEHLEAQASDSDSSSYHDLFDTPITDQDVSNEQNDSSCEETVNETCNDVIKSLTNSSVHSTDMDEPETVNETCDDVVKPLTNSSAHSTDMDEPETVDRVKNSVEFSKSMNGETDSGIHSDSVESSKLAQYEPDLDSCFLPKSNRNARNKVAVKIASSFAGNFKSNRSRSAEKSPTNEDDGKYEDETETPETNGELEISESIPKNVTVTRKRKFGELEEPSHRLELMRKLRRLKKKPIKYQTYPKLNITEEAAYSESQKEDEKKQPEQVVETVENDCVPKKKGRITHASKVLKKANISLNSCSQAGSSLVKTLEDKNVKPQTTIVNKTEADTSIVEKTPVQTIEKEDNEKLADTSNSEAVEDVCPLYSESQKEDEKKQPEQEVETVENDYVPKKKGRISHIPKVAQKANISLNSCAQARNSLFKNLEDRNVKPQTTIVNKTEADTGRVEETNMTPETPVQTIAKEDNEKLADTSNSEAVEDLCPLSPDPESPDEMSDDERCEKPIVIPVEPVFDISALIEQSAESRKGLDLNSSACKKSLTQTTNDTNVISALEEFEHREKGLEINLSDETNINFSDCKSVTETDSNTDHVYASSLQSEKTQKGREINFPVRNKPVIENDNIKNGSNTEVRTNGSNQLKELPKSSSSQDSLCRVEEVVEDNKSFDSKHLWVLGEYRAKEMNYYRDIKLNSHSPVEILERLNEENIFKSVHTKKKFKNLEHVHKMTDTFVRKELQRLVDSEWKSDVHRDVLGKLKTACTPRIIAKNIVEFLSNEEESRQTLDKTYTPPAPLMTKSQQRITALLIDLEKEFPMIIKLVLSGIEFKIFKFNQKLYRYIMESLARIFTVLARVEKDRERVRIFCCDALYCLGLNATIVLYTVITSWPEVLPVSDATKEYLPACIAHLVLSMTAVDYPKLSALKNLVRIYYKYPLGTLSNEMIKNLSNAFQEKCQGEVMASIMLLAKKEGTEWTYKNIVKAFLLPMIINNKCLSDYKAFCLLGTLMRPFPIEDSTEVDSTVEQLSELCDEVSDEQQEGVMSALMALSRHKFNVTLSHLLKWTPDLPLRDRTVDQIYGVYNQREPTFWTKCISNHKRRQT